jgi:hypothetical protein
MRLQTATIRHIKTRNFVILLFIRRGDHTWPLGSLPDCHSDCYDRSRCNRCGVSALDVDMVKDKSRLVGANYEPLRQPEH